MRGHGFDSSREVITPRRQGMASGTASWLKRGIDVLVDRVSRMPRFMIVMMFAVCAHPAAASAATVAAATEMDTVMIAGGGEIDLRRVKQKTLDLLSGGSGSGVHRIRAQAALDDRIEEILSKDRQPLSWEDPEEDLFNQRLNRFLAHSRTLAEGWASDGRYSHDERVLNRALADLDNALEHYHAKSPRPGAWYYWLIPIPDKLGAIGLLLEEALPADLRTRLEASLTHQLQEMRLSGANAAWEARNHAYLALLQQDEARLQRAAERIFSTVRYSSDGGVREDFSYLFHGHIPYAGVYGAGYAETVAQFMYLFDGTRWAANPGRRQLIVSLLLEHSRWFIHQGVWNPLVSGRVYGSRRAAAGGLAAMLYMTRVEHDESERLRGAIVALIDEGMGVRADVAAMADDVAGATGRPTSGFRFWYSAEMGAWAGDRYHVGFRQFSKRVQDYEYLSRTGGEGWNLAYGFTHLSRPGRGWFNAGEDGALPVDDIDWRRLPGTTTRVGAQPDNDASASPIGHSLNFGRSEISGGAGLADGGIAGFVLLPVHGDFIAHKSLTFFPGGFLALGSGITSQVVTDAEVANAATERAGIERPPTEHAVQTTLLQWVAAELDAAFVVDGVQIETSSEPQLLQQVAWCFIDDVGIVLPTPTDLWVRRAGRVTTVWLDHGVSPRQATYAYFVFPSTTMAETVDFASAPPVHVLHADEMAHVVADNLTDSRGLIFFAAGQAAGFTSSVPAVVYLRGDGESGALAVQDPTHRQATLNMTLPLSPNGSVRVVDEDLRLTAGERQLSLELESQLGRVYRAGWGPAGQSLQPAARVDLAAFYAFRADVESSPGRTIITVYLQDEPLEDGYELRLEGHKGHLIHVFSEADVLDRPATGVVRYVWRQQQHDQGNTRVQREGDYRLLLYTELKMATAYITIPHFDAAGNPHPSELQRDANRTPD